EKASVTRAVTPPPALGCRGEVEVEALAEAAARGHRAAIAAEGSVAPFEVSLQRSFRSAGDPGHHPPHGAGAVEGGGRALGDLNPLHVGQVECREVGGSRRATVNEDEGARVEPGILWAKAPHRYAGQQPREFDDVDRSGALEYPGQLPRRRAF